jgi:glycosyltransferase involved in cell wall biosynthesis
VKVLLVGNYPPDRQHSMLGFAALMEEGLRTAGHDVATIYPPVVFGKLGSYVPPASKWLAYLDKFLLLPPLLKRACRDADIVHICDHSNAVYVPEKRDIPHVVTCHDLLAVRGGLGEQTDCPATYMGARLQTWIVSGLMRADGVACDSTATLADAARLLSERQQPPVLLPIALRGDFMPMASARRIELLRTVPLLDLNKPYVLHVGSSLRRKNREGILRIFAKLTGKLDAQLVFAGKRLEPQQRKLAEELNIQQHIIETGEISSELLVALYGGALVFLFPSRFEGFGWPIIEAQASGCPVVCTNREPLSEVAGDSAVLRDLDDEDGFAADIVRISTDKNLRADLIERGFRNVERYKPEVMISKYVSLYEQVLSNRC